MQQFPKSVSRAINSTTQWLKRHEDWTVSDVTFGQQAQLVNIAIRAHDMSGRSIPRKSRRDIITVAAYFPPEVRMSFIINLARVRPDVLDDIMLGEYDPRSEPARFNLFATMGVFARRSLLSDIFTEDRMEMVEQFFGDQKGEHQ